jgi:hypothetical protein
MVLVWLGICKEFLPFLQRNRRHSAVVEYVFSGHRFKLTIPKETCSIAFSLSGVRCPGKGEPYSDEAIALMRRRILQRDVEVQFYLSSLSSYARFQFLKGAIDTRR